MIYETTQCVESELRHTHNMYVTSKLVGPKLRYEHPVPCAARRAHDLSRYKDIWIENKTMQPNEYLKRQN